MPLSSTTLDIFFKNRACCIASVALLSVGTLQAEDNTPDNPFALSLEQLMNVEVTTASKFPQNKMDAPAAVTVISADDIKDYGYRSLADILRSIRGINMTHDRAYEYVGVRGFGRSGDYNARVLLMIDGRRVNDVMYDSALVGSEGLVEVENVARVEFVPGSGSALYGSNAFFGVINVITKQGKDYQGGEIAGGFGSYGTDKEKGTLGYRFDNGADLLLSASRWRSDGHHNLRYDRLSDPNAQAFNSVDLDGFKADRLFGKFSYNGWELEGAFASRSKALPIAGYGSDINAPLSYRDRNGFAEARHEKVFKNGLTTHTRVYWGFSDFDDYFRFSGTRNIDVLNSQWWGSELKMLYTLGDHRLVAGSEYQSNFVQNLENHDAEPYQSYMDIRRSSHRYGFYIQDEYSITDQLMLNAGVRWDYYSVSGDTTNPRIGLIYKPQPDLALKLLYGTAFRAPNAYELYYLSPYQVAPQGLRPEHVESVEGIAEYQATRNLRLTATLFHNDVTDLINLIPEPGNPGFSVYRNNAQVEMQGSEFESEYRWDSGARLRGSYTYNYAKDLNAGRWLENSPRHLAKLNASVPIWQDQLRAGTELQYVSDRKTKVGHSPGYAIANLTLTATKIVPNLDVSASVYNLLDKRYTHAAGLETIINQIPQDGRNFRVWFNYRF